MEITEVTTVEAEVSRASVREESLHIVRERVAKANQRLAKAGIEERFGLEVSNRRLVEERNEGGVVTDRAWFVDVELAVPSIGYNGWRFVATLSFEEGGTIVRTVPGEELNGYRPVDQACDQCHTRRGRNATYVVRNDETGEMKQVGSNCLALFFGLKPNLWVYEVQVGVSEEEEGRSGGQRGISVESVRNIVAAALGVSKGGAGYLSRAAAGYQQESTGEATKACLYERETNSKDRWAAERRAQLAGWREETNRYLAEGTLVDAVIEAAKAITGEGDYVENIRVLANSEWVATQNIGYVASFVAVYNNAIQREVERKIKAARVQEFIGQVGDKKVVTTGTVVAIRYVDSMYGTSTLIEWVTDEGLTCKWFSTNDVDVAEGARVTVTGTIKKHEEYKGLKATLFTRCKVEKLA